HPEGGVCAMMELKAMDADKWDLLRCVLMTSMTAAGVAELRPDIIENQNILFPFVVGTGLRADLYATCFDENKRIRVCVIAASVDLSILRFRLDFIAKLMVLLSALANFINGSARHLSAVPTNVKLVNSEGAKLNNALDSARYKSSKADEDSSRSSKPPPSKRPKGNQEVSATAKLVAAREGRIAVIGPLTHLNREKSPFCFRGSYLCSSSVSRPVVCKVWRDGDRNFTCRRVEHEIDMLEQALQGGVPTPAVYSHMNVVDYKFMDRVYHVLVMSYIEKEEVQPSQLSQYALSLVKAVERLHCIGILHCDIKPENVLWNARLGLYLIDFEHAQPIGGAKHSRSTRQFTAPEVLHQKQPHSIQSDCFSVGETLRRVCNNVHLTKCVANDFV
ncbi:MAG: protein kinase domain-containing protein, partial [Gaiellaceae bacterium]